MTITKLLASQPLFPTYFLVECWGKVAKPPISSPLIHIVQQSSAVGSIWVLKLHGDVRVIVNVKISLLMPKQIKQINY